MLNMSSPYQNESSAYKLSLSVCFRQNLMLSYACSSTYLEEFFFEQVISKKIIF